MPEAEERPNSGINEKLFFWASEKQFDYGKWVLSSLLTVHAGSLFAISQAGTKREALYEACGPWLIYGIACTLVAGGLAWFNYTFLTILYGDRVLGQSKDNRLLSMGVTGTLRLAPIIAVISLAFFITATVKASWVLDERKTEFWYNTDTTADDPR